MKENVLLNYKVVKELAKRQGYTMASLARELALSRQGLYDKLRKGTNSFKKERLENLLKILELEERDIEKIQKM